MPSSYSSNLRLELIASGEQSNTWGNTTNTNLGTLLESAIAGRVELSSGWAANSLTLTALNGANDQSRQMCLVVPAITISANSTIIVPASAVTASSGKMYTVINKSTSYSVTIKLPASTGVTIPANTAKTVIYNGTDFQEAFTALDLLTLTGTPTTTTHAVNKGYVDGKFFSIADNNTVSGNTTFTGAVTLPAATPTGNQATSYNYVNTNYLWKASGVTSQTMQPYLKLAQTPVDADHAVNKGYVDSNYVGISTVQTISGTKTFSTNVSLSGSAQLVLPNAPLDGTHATNKTYVDGAISAAETTASNTFALKTRRIYGSSSIAVNGVAGGSADLSSDITLSVAGASAITSLTATAPLTATGTTAVNLSISLANATTNGYIAGSDWDRFDKKCNANGSNASGTWGIGITGNAGTASLPASGGTFITSSNIGSQTVASCTGNAATATAPAGGGTFITSSNIGSQTVANCTGNAATATRATYLSHTTAYSWSTPTTSSPTTDSAGIYFRTGTAAARALTCIHSNNGDTGLPLLVGRTNAANNAGVAGSVIGFAYGSSAISGASIAIDAGGGSVSYLTGSDYRLKENITPLSSALVKIMGLNPVSFEYKVSPGVLNEGFIAHELAEHVPFAVTGEKDAVDEDGDPKYQGVDMGKLIPTLVKAIQELKAEVDALKGA